MIPSVAGNRDLLSAPLAVMPSARADAARVGAAGGNAVGAGGDYVISAADRDSGRISNGDGIGLISISIGATDGDAVGAADGDAVCAVDCG